MHLSADVAYEFVWHILKGLLDMHVPSDFDMHGISWSC